MDLTKWTVINKIIMEELWISLVTLWVEEGKSMGKNRECGILGTQIIDRVCWLSDHPFKVETSSEKA
jgi:hypothetical protein